MSGRLTDRHVELLEHIAHGRRHDDIAHLMGAPLPTVRRWIKGAYANLGARTAAQAVHLAYQAGLLLAPVTPTADQHVVEIRARGWAIQHPETCRHPTLGVWDCPINRAALGRRPSPGRYVCTLAGDRLVIGPPALPAGV